MTTIQAKTLSETATPMTPAGLRILDLRPRQVEDSKKRSDVQCGLCARSFSNAPHHMDIPLCPACHRHLAAIPDDRIKSCIIHRLQKELSSEAFSTRHLKRAAS